MLSGGLTWWFSHDPHEPEYICFVFVPVQFAGDQSVQRRSAQRALVRVPKSDDDVRCAVADH